MSQYLILIYEDEPAGNPTPELGGRPMEAHGRFSEQVVELGGKMLGGEALQPTATATSDPRRRGDRRPVRRDQGGARRLLPDRGATTSTTRWRSRSSCPAGVGGVEVRPIMDTSGM